MNKYNVNDEKPGRTYDGIVFASVLEMRYYRDVVLPLSEKGDITYFELQKPYILQGEFSHNGKNVLPIKYIADFYIEYKDGRIEVIDTKGCPDEVAKIKRKLFWFKYPNITYRWMTYVKKYGGWRDYDDVKYLRRKEKYERKKKEL